MSVLRRLLSTLIDSGERYQLEGGVGKTIRELAMEARFGSIDAWARMVIAHNDRPLTEEQSITDMALLKGGSHERITHPLMAMEALKFHRPIHADAVRFARKYHYLTREGPVAFLHEPSQDPFGLRCVLVLSWDYFNGLQLTADYIGRRWESTVRFAARP